MRAASCEHKHLDLIAANQSASPGSGFESDDNALTVYWPRRSSAHSARRRRPQLAEALLDLIAGRRLRARHDAHA